MQPINRDELQQWVAENRKFTLVEVLAPEYFKKYHIPGAINVPLDEDFEAKIQETIPDKSHRIVVYCANTECDASPRAAKKMDDLGYEAIFDYEEGKEGWKEAGLPVDKAA